MEDIKEYIEELVAFKRSCTVKFKNELGSKITAQLKIIDFYIEEGIEYIITDGGIRIPINAIVDVDNMRFNSIG
jgi:hypothetical protein